MSGCAVCVPANAVPLPAITVSPATHSGLRLRNSPCASGRGRSHVAGSGEVAQVMPLLCGPCLSGSAYITHHLLSFGLFG